MISHGSTNSMTTQIMLPWGTKNMPLMFSRQLICFGAIWGPNLNPHRSWNEQGAQMKNSLHILYVISQNWADRRSSTNLHIWEPNVFQMALSYPVCINLKRSTQKRWPQHGTAGQPWMMRWYTAARLQLAESNMSSAYKGNRQYAPTVMALPTAPKPTMERSFCNNHQKAVLQLAVNKMVPPRNVQPKKVSRMQICCSMHDLVIVQQGWHCQQDVGGIMNAIQAVC